MLNPAAFVGRAPEQTAEFLAGHVRPLLEQHRDWLGLSADIGV
jgi:adenylosuccinate lyase